MIVRDRRPGDGAAIRGLIDGAFAPSTAEGPLVDQLRSDGAMAMELVAQAGVDIVGHIAFSRLDAPMRAVALAPMAVAPDRQRSGIGASLIWAGLDRIRDDGWQAVFVLGDPAYYGRFGFRAETAKGYECPYSGEYLQALWLEEADWPTEGPIAYPAAFGAAG